MSTKPKLQDTLEVFMEELETLRISINGLKKLNPEMDAKIKELKNVSIKLDVSQLELDKQKLLKEFDVKLEKMETIYNQHIENLKSSVQKEKGYINRYFYFAIGVFVVLFASITVSFKLYYQSKEYENSLKTNLSERKILSEYILESKQSETFDKWLDKKRKERK